MSRFLGWALLTTCTVACLGVAAWQAKSGEWVGTSMFSFLAGTANAFATALMDPEQVASWWFRVIGRQPDVVVDLHPEPMAVGILHPQPIVLGVAEVLELRGDMSDLAAAVRELNLQLAVAGLRSVQ